MKRIIKITLAIFLLLGIVGFIFAAYSISGLLTEFDDAFLFIEGQEGFVYLKVNLKKPQGFYTNGLGEINKPQKMRISGLYQLMDTSA